MPSAISYTRFSSSRQQYGASLARQQDMQARWLERNPEYTLSPLNFADLGKSGWSGEHLDHGFGRLLEAVKSGAIKSGDAVIIEAMDRAGRQKPLDMLPLVTSILNAGVSIHTLDDGMIYTQDSANHQHLFLLLAKIQQAYQYSETLSRRVLDSYERRKVKARAGGGVERTTPVWLTTGGDLIPDVAALIATAFDDYAAGIGERRIVRRLRDTGHPVFASIVGSTVKRWLRNPTAIGYWGDIPDVYPPAVDKHLFYLVQNKLKTNKRGGSAPTKHLLTGLVKCGHCGKNFNVRQYKNTPALMQCSSRARLSFSGCDNKKSIPKQVLEFIRIRTSLNYVKQALAGHQLTLNQKRVVLVIGELENIDRKLANLSTAIADVGAVPQLIKDLKLLQHQHATLEEERLILERSEDDGIKDTMAAIEAEGDYLQNDPLKLNAMLQNVGYMITCNGDGSMIVSGDPSPWLYEGSEWRIRAYRVSYKGFSHLIRTVRPGDLDPQGNAASMYPVLSPYDEQTPSRVVYRALYNRELLSRPDKK